jgi:class 3 adenylate cyclase/tetratricopeptide (TPR) repeat protein
VHPERSTDDTSTPRGAPRALPTGNVTFLFTDIEGSTRLFQQHPDAMKGALARHHALVQEAIDAHQGHVFNVLGDGFCAAFADATQAIAAALAAQRTLNSERWGVPEALRVRMGLHTGHAEAHNSGYAASLTLARTQRVAAAAHGGEVLLSQATAHGIESNLLPGTTLNNLGAFKLRGIAQPEMLYQLVAADLPSAFPPPRAEAVASTAAAPLQQLVRGRLVGRAAEQRQLRERWSEARQGRGRLVLLSGEPGVGKTRLAADLLEQARQTDATVLRGGCYEFEAATPYLPFVEAIRDWARWQSAERLRETIASTPEIGKFAPEIDARVGAPAPHAALSPGEERLRLFDNAARFFQSLATGAGIVVFIDDIHWADQGTLSLLHYLLRHLRNDPILFLAAYREVELDRTHPLAAALVEWNRERLAERVHLGRFSRADTGALLAALFGVERVSDELTDALYRETEGNPFFVEEVIKSLIEQGQIYRDGESWRRKEAGELSIPQSVKEAIGRRLDRLTPSAVEALRVAAALGKHFVFGELAAASTAGEEALLDALDEASAAQLVRASSEGPRGGGDEGFAFTHDKIREVLYQELNPIRRRRLHQKIAEALEARQGAGAPGSDARSQDLAHHFTLAGDLPKSLVYWRLAARSAERVFAHDEALKYLDEARQAADALQRGEDLVAIDEQIGDIREMRGTAHPAVESYERALAAAAVPATRAALKAKIGSSYCAIGDPRGLACVEAALVELDPATQANALALALANMGRYHHYRTEHRKAIELLTRARELAEPTGDPDIVTQIYTYLAGAYQHLTLYDDSDRWARASIALGERADFPAAIAGGYEFLGENAVGRGRWDDAIAFGRKDREFGEKVGSLSRVAWSMFCFVQGHHGKGELATARAGALEALELCERIGEDRLATWLFPSLALVEADMGAEQAARATAAQGWTGAQELGQRVLSAWALHAAGYAAMLRGDLDASLDWYDKCAAQLGDTENRVARLLVGPCAAEALLRAKRIEDALGRVEEDLRVAEFAKAPHRIALARRVHGQILGAQGRCDDALRLLDDAVAMLAQCGSRLELARAIHHRGSLRVARGDARDREAGQADIARARDELAAMGAKAAPT